MCLYTTLIIGKLVIAHGATGDGTVIAVGEIVATCSLLKGEMIISEI